MSDIPFEEVKKQFEHHLVKTQKQDVDDKEHVLDINTPDEHPDLIVEDFKTQPTPLPEVKVDVPSDGVVEKNETSKPKGVKP